MGGVDCQQEQLKRSPVFTSNTAVPSMGGGAHLPSAHVHVHVYMGVHMPFHFWRHVEHAHEYLPFWPWRPCGGRR